jgi:hypothetical protein
MAIWIFQSAVQLFLAKTTQSFNTIPIKKSSAWPLWFDWGSIRNKNWNEVLDRNDCNHLKSLNK